MTHTVEDTLIRPKRRRRKRTQSRFERWAWSEIPAYRLGLTLGYAVTVYIGASAFIAGVPAFTLAAPEGWTPIWAVFLVLGGGIASIGSVSGSNAFRRIELVGSWIAFIALAAYAGTLLYIAYGAGDATRSVAGAGFVGLAIPPGVRMLWLMAKVLPRQERG